LKDIFVKVKRQNLSYMKGNGLPTGLLEWVRHHFGLYTSFLELYTMTDMGDVHDVDLPLTTHKDRVRSAHVWLGLDLCLETASCESSSLNPMHHSRR